MSKKKDGDISSNKRGGTKRARQAPPSAPTPAPAPPLPPVPPPAPAPAAAPAARCACLAGIPDALVAHVAPFLAKWDRGSLLNLSKGVRAAVLTGIEGLNAGFNTLARGTESFRRLLGRLPHLQGLSLSNDAAGRVAIQAIGEGVLGQGLRCVSLNGLQPDDQLRSSAICGPAGCRCSSGST